MTKEIEVKQITHYSVEDPECIRDYYDIELIIADEIVARFGDYYHDKGLEKAEGFILGVQWATGAVVRLITENVADRV